MSDAQKAVLLLSGGLDSATVLALAKSQGFEISAISFKYGQRHAQELSAARALAEAADVARHAVMEIDLRAYGGSALTDDIAVPKDRSAADMAGDIPVTYVPARNTIFLAHALALAEVQAAGHIFIGVNALDYSGYPDCRPAYIQAFETMANLATRAGVEGTAPVTIAAPLMDMTKAEIIRVGTDLGVDYAMTISCYDPPQESELIHCGRCDACALRKKGFADAGVADPTTYAD